MRIFIDLETIPDQKPDAFDRCLAAVKPPGNYKKPETIEAWLEENAHKIATEQLEKTSLDGLHGEICAIGFALGDLPAESYVRHHGDSEADLLVLFYDYVRKRLNKYQFPQWIGHNLLDFDLRLLKQRTAVNKIPVEKRLFIPADSRHGGDHVFDTMKEWAGWKGYVKQDELATAFGLPTKGEFDGSKVWDAW